jgi:predicted nucleic acid-binding protein
MAPSRRGAGQWPNPYRIGWVKLLLDTNVLTRLCHPGKPENAEISAWLAELLTRRSDEVQVCVPEIADYESRRGLLHVALRSQRPTTRSLQRLDQLIELLTFLPINTPILRRAADLWAQSRSIGQPTSPKEVLDGDVISRRRHWTPTGLW